jgi:peptidoglycan/xylan/chitin deacetylase (PgdA/CDA1 family)
MYHEIVSGEPQEIHAVSVAQFTSQMNWLQQNGYTIVGFESQLSNDLRNILFPQKSVVLTFDDGYLDNYTNALPVLQQLGISATFFLIGGYIGSTSKWRKGNLSTTPLLNLQQVREMDRMGMQFGSHSMTHSDLTTLIPETLKQEISQSRNELEQALGKTVDTFSYPYSRYNSLTIECLKAHKYRLACTFQPGYVGRAGSKQFELQRIGIIATDSLKNFTMKVRGSLTKQLSWYLHAFEKRTKIRLHVSKPHNKP